MIPLPSQPKIVKKETNRAVFEIEALYPGYGVTIANSMRRVLLSSLQGAAITQVKIKGVSHEFSTIPGVQEDVITLMLNLKNLRFKVFSDEPQLGKFHIKGEKKVEGSDFELPSQVELVNKKGHIATLTARSSDLDMEITIEKGVGFSSRESRADEKLAIGLISLDAIFSPIRKVSFKVENMRVGDRTDFDKLFLEIETDGTISPETAFSQASKTLVEHFDLLNQAFKEEPVFKKEYSGKEDKEKKTVKKGDKKHKPEKAKGKKK